MLRNLAKVTCVITRQYCTRTPTPTRKPELSTVNKVFRKAFGDLIEQELEYQQKALSKRYDYGRLCRMFMVGLSQGPLHHYYYLWLSKVLPDRRMVTITKKILLDQFVMSPICIVGFFYGLAILESQTFKQATEELSEKFVEIYTMDWAVWPPAQFINFYFIPVRYQVMYINGITTLYNAFCSYIKHRHEISEENTVKKEVI